MSSKQEAYRGMIIEVNSFQLLGTGHFMTSLTVLERMDSRTVLVEMPVTHLMFDSEDRALQETLAHGRLLVDGLVREPGTKEAMFKKASPLKRRSTDRN